MKPPFQLRLARDEIRHWAERYVDDDEPVLAMVPSVRQRGFMSKSEFLTVCRWKTPRTQARCRANSEEFIREVTSCALGAGEERLRIEVLTLMSGVGWPTASVILHFFHAEPYPILDVRALWSLHTDVPKQYDFGFWQEYTCTCRRLARQSDVSMRVLDRGLWQYSKEKQQ